MATVRLTVGQAIVKYLQVQYSEADGVQQRLIPAMLGIFGHGNVGGLGQGLLTLGDDLPYIQSRNEQATVHHAVGFAKASRRRSTFACTASIGPGSTNMVTGAAAQGAMRRHIVETRDALLAQEAKTPGPRGEVT